MRIESIQTLRAISALSWPVPTFGAVYYRLMDLLTLPAINCVFRSILCPQSLRTWLPVPTCDIGSHVPPGKLAPHVPINQYGTFFSYPTNYVSPQNKRLTLSLVGQGALGSLATGPQATREMERSIPSHDRQGPASKITVSSRAIM